MPPTAFRGRHQTPSPERRSARRGWTSERSLARFGLKRSEQGRVVRRLCAVAFRAEDLDALLEELRRRDNYSLPFEIRPVGRGTEARALAATVNDAIGVANHEAEARVPLDPTWCTDADVLGGRLFAEIQKGCLEDDEVRAWLVDLDRAIEAQGIRVRIGVHKPRVRVPNLAEWYLLPPALSAYLHFAASVQSDGRRRIDPSVVAEFAEPLIAWSRVPGAPLVISKGLAEGVVPESQGVETLLEGLPDEEQFGVWRATPNPQRLKFARFSYDALGDLQVLDTTPPQTQLEDLLDALRILARHLDYAYVRRGMTSGPSEGDIGILLRRELSYVEEHTTYGRGAQLFPDYALDVFVAQVLTDSHLAKASDLSLFHVEAMGQGRHLVHARDPEPWINGPTPPDDLLNEARSGFDAMLLTEDLVRTHVPG